MAMPLAFVMAGSHIGAGTVLIVAIVNFGSGFAAKEWFYNRLAMRPYRWKTMLWTDLPDLSWVWCLRRRGTYSRRNAPRVLR
ncbi:MAG TPA: hypothetical protein VMI31_13930 [Fimbriimonadaceae bacterium]|nr:hypothetical protein [Fimbriimonadaceae bacterium]